MRSVVFIVVWFAVGVVSAAAEPCLGNPDALGTSRILTISPGELSRIGSIQYSAIAAA